ncbi:MAG: response regulator [Sneathiella sp.]
MPLTVFYLDDEEKLCDVFKEYLETEAIHIVTFTEPEEAIEACLKKAPDLLFIDYRLPATTGDEVAFAIANSIPKVLVTGDLSLTPSYDFLTIISKPYDLKEIDKLLEKFL